MQNKKTFSWLKIFKSNNLFPIPHRTAPTGSTLQQQDFYCSRSKSCQVRPGNKTNSTKDQARWAAEVVGVVCGGFLRVLHKCMMHEASSQTKHPPLPTHTQYYWGEGATFWRCNTTVRCIVAMLFTYSRRFESWEKAGSCWMESGLWSIGAKGRGSGEGFKTEEKPERGTEIWVIGNPMSSFELMLNLW